jgi:hypothetical protein
MLEAERRGILPPDKKALLDEAKSRGLVGGAEPEPEPATSDVFDPIGLKRQDDTGQLFFESPDTPPAYKDYSPEEYEQAPFLERRATDVLRTADAIIPDDIGSSFLGGIRDAAVGALTLPADVASHFGSDAYQPTAEFIRRNVPEFRRPGKDTAGDIAQTVIQYAGPGAKGGQLGVKAANKFPGMAEKATSTLGKVRQGTAKALGGMAGAAAADVAVTDPEDAATLGDIFTMLPTDIQPDDSNLTKRAKVGAETLGVETAARGVVNALKGGRVAVNTLRDVTKPLDETKAAADLASTLQKQTSDLPSAIKNLDESTEFYEGSSFKPTTGKASRDPGLMRIEQGLATKGGPVGDQIEANTVDTARKVKEFGTARSSNEAVDEIGRAAEAEKTATMAPVVEQQSGLAKRLEDMNVRMGEMSKDVSEKARGGTKASEAIDSQIRALDQEMTATKNDLFNAADPDGSLQIPADDFMEQIDAIKPGKLEDPEAFPSDIIGDIKRKLSPEPPAEAVEGIAEGVAETVEPAMLSFRDLIDLRGRVANSIGRARAKGTTSLTRYLQLKEAVDKQIDNFAGDLSPEMQGAALKLREAQDYYANEFSPRFKKGEGGKLRKEQKSGRPGAAPPSATASRFLGPGKGAKERAQDLSRLIGKNDPNAREYVLAEMAKSVGSPQGLKGKQLEAWAGRFDKFKRANQDMLAEYPEIRKEVAQMRNRVGAGAKKTAQIETDLAAATETVGRTEKDFARSEAGRYLKADKPETAVEDLLKSKDILRRGRQMMRLVEKDKGGQAREGLKDLVRAEMNKKFVQKSVTNSDPALRKTSQASLVDFFEDPVYGKERSAFVDELFADTPGELKTLRDIRRQMSDLSRQVQGTAGSQTASVEQQVKDAEGLLVSVFGSVYGLGGRARASSRIDVLNKILSKFNRDPKSIAQTLLNDAFTDPALARKMLTMKVNEKTSPLIEKELRTYIWNNILGDGERSEERNQEEDIEE